MITMEITTTAQEYLRKLQEFSVTAPQVIARAMDRENQETIGHIRSARMTGKGPFPPSEGRLGVRTNRLRGSVRASKAQIFGGVVFSSIGSNVEYAAIHEFGGRTKPHKITARFAKALAIMGGRFVGRKEIGAAFKGLRGNARASAIDGNVTFRRSVNHPGSNIPARAPISRGIADRKWAYDASISQAIVTEGRRLKL